MARIYTHVKQIETKVLQLKEKGKTNREIAQEFGLKEKQIVNLVTRYNRRNEKLQKGLPPKRRGRPPKSTTTNQEQMRIKIERLEMENTLLRSFLQAAGRR